MTGANPTAVRLCFSTAVNGGTPALDPAKVAGKIVVCERGTNDRVNKSLAVQEAGGIGMVLVNVTPGTLNADFHVVPTVHSARHGSRRGRESTLAPLERRQRLAKPSLTFRRRHRSSQGSHPADHNWLAPGTC